MSEQQFSAKIIKSAGRLVIAIPFRPDEEWGRRERYHITGAVNGHAVRGPLRYQEGQYFLALGPAWLRDNGLGDGATVNVSIRLEGPQMDNMPEDVAAALEADSQAREFFESLPTFYRKNFMRWIDSAKRQDTRSARIAEMMELIKAGKRER